jgi:hypothetical protein
MQEQFSKWSWSMLGVYRTCPLWAKFKYLDRLPEPEREKDDARDRGTQRHKLSEDFILADDAPFPAELIKFEGPLTDVRDIRKNKLGIVELEQPFYFNQYWKPCEEKDRWLVVIPDIKVTIPGELSLTIDNKTGKRYGNELKHFGQCELYSISAMILDPSHESYEAELWYLDIPDTWQITFTQEKLEKARAKIDAEVAKMMDDKYFRPRPSKLNCRYCPYGPRGTGACPVGVT